MTFITTTINSFESEIGKNYVKNPTVNPEDFGEKNSNKNRVKTPAKAGGATLHIVGIPHEMSKDFIERFLRDKITI